MKIETQAKRFGILLALPGLLVVFGTIFYPLGVGIFYSFQKAHLLKLKKASWFGFGNYEKLFADDYFWNALWNTITFTTLWTIGAAIIGLMLAVALNRETLLNRIIGSLLLIPWIMPPVCIAYMFNYFYAGRNGIIWEVLLYFGLVERRYILTAEQNFSVIFVIINTMWIAFPFFMVMFLAGLKTIPKEIVEAAKIDGANAINNFKYITLPHLKNIIVIATTLSIVWGFNFFDLIWATTKGGPYGRTETLVLLAQRVAFNQMNLGYTSALGVLWLIGLTIFSVIYLKSMKVI